MDNGRGISGISRIDDGRHGAGRIGLPGLSATASRRRLLRTLLFFSVLSSAGYVSVEAADTIAGRVINANTGFPVQGADLDVFDSNGKSVPITDAATGGPGATDTNGDYNIQLPGGGTYILRVDLSTTAPLADRYYGDTILKSQATPIEVPAGADVSGIDIALVGGVPIEGTVRSGGSPLPDIDIDVYEAVTGEFLGSYPGLTDVDGNYSIGAFPAGSYLVQADPNAAAGQLYVSQFYGGGPDPVTATPVSVGTQPVTGIDFDLPTGGAISGMILSGDSGAPLESIDLDIFTSGGERLIFNGSSKTDGSYAVGPLPAGQYVLRADPTIEQAYARSYFSTTNPGTVAFKEASVITVIDSQMTAGVDFDLPPGESISGTIRDAVTLQGLANIDLDVFDSAGNRVDLTTRTDLNGNYQVGPLPAGQYVVRADPAATDGYLRQYFSGQTDKALATVITVDANGLATEGIDFDLPRAGWLTGIVRDAGGNPLANIDLDVFDSTSKERPGGDAITAADGSFVFGPLAPGDYTVRCDPTIAQGYAVEYFDAKINKTLADPVTVTEGAATAVDFTLEPGGVFFGQLVSRYDGAALAGVDIDIFDAVSGIRLDQSSKTDLDGNWSLGPLPAGSYIIRADVLPESPFSDIYSGNQRLSKNAVPLSLAAGEEQTVPMLLLPPDLVIPSLALAINPLTNLELTFQTAQGLIYTIEYASGLGQNNWQPLETFTGSGSVHAYLPEQATLDAFDRGFLRVRVD